jgi:hypothetical protein
VHSLLPRAKGSFAWEHCSANGRLGHRFKASPGITKHYKRGSQPQLHCNSEAGPQSIACLTTALRSPRTSLSVERARHVHPRPAIMHSLKLRFHSTPTAANVPKDRLFAAQMLANGAEDRYFAAIPIVRVPTAEPHPAPNRRAQLRLQL